MSSTGTSRAAWFQMSLNTLLVVVLVVAAFFAGWGLEQRRAEKAIQEAQEAADAARREQARLQFELDGGPPIERIREGDSVVTIGTDGKPASTKVVSVFITRNRLLNVRTDSGDLQTTQTQPVCLETGELRSAGELKAGDVICRWDGTRRKAATVRQVTAGRVAQVFNLVLGEPTVFVAGDFLVRSKPPADTVALAR
jgi:hypothetical protein